MAQVHVGMPFGQVLQIMGVPLHTGGSGAELASWKIAGDGLTGVAMNGAAPDSEVFAFSDEQPPFGHTADR